MTYTIRHCVTWPWPGQTLPIPGPGQMELTKPCMCTSLCQEHSFIFPSLCPAHPPGLTLDTQLHPLIWHASPASPPLGPQGPGSVVPPELLYLRILDTAWVASGGPKGDHRAPPCSCPPTPSRPQLYYGCLFSHLRPPGTWYSLAHSGSLNNVHCVPWVPSFAIWLEDLAPSLSLSLSLLG